MNVHPRFRAGLGLLGVLGISLLLVLVALGSAWAGPGQESPAIRAIEGFRVPPGMRVRLFADENQLTNPVAICIDDQGRLFVAESDRAGHGVTDNRSNSYWLTDDLAAQTVEDRLAIYKKWADRGKHPMEWYTSAQDRVRLLEDRDGDGLADRSTVFAGDFRQPLDGLGSGLIAREGKVWYTNIPHLWLLEDPNADGEAEIRHALLRGFGVRTAFIGHDLHGLAWGPDGKLYFSVGDRGFNVQTQEGMVLRDPGRGAVFRCHPDGSGLEVVYRGLRNPQELAFDDHGNLFTCDNNSDAGDEARLVWIVEGGNSGWDMAYQYMEGGYSRGPWHMEKIWHLRHPDQPAWILPPLAHVGGGPSGLAFYPGLGLGERYRGHFFMCDFHGSPSNSRIQSFGVEPDGAGFRMTDDHTFMEGILATDIEFAYDGTIYISDWVRGWGSEDKKGRIYTLSTPAGPEAPQQAQIAAVAGQFAQGFGKLGQEELLGLLEHPDMRMRQRAQFELAKRGAPEPLHRVVRESAHPLARLHALWGLGQIPSVHGGALCDYLHHADPEVRAQAGRVLADKGNGCPSLLTAMKDPSLRVRFFAAMALGKCAGKWSADSRGLAMTALIDMLRANNDQDLYIRHGAVMGLVGLSDPGMILAHEADPSPAVRMGILLALRKLEDPGLVRFLDDPDPRLVQETARAIHDLPMTQGLPGLAGLMKRGPISNEPLLRRVINANFRLGQPSHAQVLVNLSLDGSQETRMRLQALAALGDWASPADLDRVLGSFRPLEKRDGAPVAKILQENFESLAASATPEMEAPLLRLAGVYPTAPLDQTLLAWVRDAKRTVPGRIEALALLGTRKAQGLEEALEKALADPDPALRSSARDVMARSDPDGALVLLQEVLLQVQVQEKQMALATLATMQHPGADGLILGAMKDLLAGKADQAIELDILETAEARPDEKLKEALATYNASLDANDPLAPYRVVMAGGDPQRGAAIFNDHAGASCLRCHRLDGRGGQAGPDLSNIAQKHDPKYLLESLILPNARIAEGYQMVILEMADGSTASGSLLEETPTVLRLGTTDGDILELAPGQILKRHSTPISAMPPMGPILDRRQLRDLLAFLAGKK